MDKPKIKWSPIIVVDVLLVNIAFLFAYLTGRQFGFDPLEEPTSLSLVLQNADISPFQHFLGIAALVTIARVGILLAVNIYKPMWKHASVQEFRKLATAVLLATLGLIALAVPLKIAWVLFLIDGFYNFALIGFTKFSAQLLQRDKRVVNRGPRRTKHANGGNTHSHLPARKPPTKVLIVGAGETGIGVLREIRNHPEKGYVPVGFIDDSSRKVGRTVAGLEVLGTTRDLTYIAHKRTVDEVVIAIHRHRVEKFVRLSDSVNIEDVSSRSFPTFTRSLKDGQVSVKFGKFDSRTSSTDLPHRWTSPKSPNTYLVNASW